jgi:hypothetical protein
VVSVVVVIGISLACGSSGPAPTVAPRATPNVLAREQLDVTFAVNVASVPNESICALGAEGRACVEGFRDAIGSGLEQVLRLYMPHDPRNPEYVAVFRLVEFGASPAAVHERMETVAAFLSLRWQFELRTRDGRPVVQLAARTEGPDAVMLDRSMAVGVRSLVNRVLESIANEMNTHLSRNRTQESAAPIDATTPPDIL